MHNVMNALLNTILVSVPEELFLTAMTLILVKRPDLLDIRMWRQNLKWLAIPVLPAALIINVLKYIIIIPQDFILLITIAIMYISILFITIRTQFELDKHIYWKTIIFLVGSFALWALLEGVTYSILLTLINKPLEFVTNNIYWNFIISIPSRIIAYLPLIYIIVKKNNEIKIKVFDVIIKNRLYSRIMLFCTVSFNLGSLFVIKLIWHNKILENNVSFIEKIVVSESLFILPAIVIFLMIILINNLLVKEKQIQQTYENLIYKDDVTADVEN